MKRIMTAVVLFFVFVMFVQNYVFAEDLYDKMADELSQGGDVLTKKRVAILPFAYVDGRKSPGGAIVSERLTTRIIKLRKLGIVERSLLEKVMEELKLQATGAIDSSSAKELGKLLGVEAIVVGSLMATQDGRVEINARLIKTETAEAIVASNVTIERDWAEEEVEGAPPERVPPRYVVPVRRAPTGPRFSFFDVLYGLGRPKINLKFKNTYANIECVELGITSSLTGSYKSISWENLTSGGSGPFAFRIGGFGQYALGGEFEFSYETNNIKKQQTTWKVNDIQRGTFNFNSDDYLTVKSLIMSGDLLVRIPGKEVNPYFGVGFGLSLNFINLPYVYGLTTTTSYLSKPTDDTGLGFVVRFPVGLRFRIAELGSLFTEARYQIHSVFFDRDIKYESDSITLSGFRFLFGMSFLF